MRLNTLYILNRLGISFIISSGKVKKVAFHA